MTVKYNRGSKDNLIQYEVSSQNGDRLAGEVEVMMSRRMRDGVMRRIRRFQIML